MPRSGILYASSAVLFQLKERLGGRFAPEVVKPYTLSAAHKTQGDFCRIRFTELVEHSLSPIIDELLTSGQALPVSRADNDVRGTSYEHLLQDADRFQRTAILQFSSPTIIDFGGYSVPFPVLPLMLSSYLHLWNAFARLEIPRAAELLRHIKMRDFKCSCVRSTHGPGFQGWVTMEMDKGRSEEEIRAFNVLIDFAFYCGTGLHTEEGLGQTGRAKGHGLTSKAKG